MKNKKIKISENFHFLVVKYSVCLNRLVFVMDAKTMHNCCSTSNVTGSYMQIKFNRKKNSTSIWLIVVIVTLNIRTLLLIPYFP